MSNRLLAHFRPARLYDQIRRFIALWQLSKAGGNNYFAQIVYIFLTFGLFIFLVKYFSGNFYRHLAIFYGHTDDLDGRAGASASQRDRDEGADREQAQGQEHDQDDRKLLDDVGLIVEERNEFGLTEVRARDERKG